VHVNEIGSATTSRSSSAAWSVCSSGSLDGPIWVAALRAAQVFVNYNTCLARADTCISKRHLIARLSFFDTLHQARGEAKIDPLGLLPGRRFGYAAGRRYDRGRAVKTPVADQKALQNPCGANEHKTIRRGPITAVSFGDGERKETGATLHGRSSGASRSQGRRTVPVFRKH